MGLANRGLDYVSATAINWQGPRRVCCPLHCLLGSALGVTVGLLQAFVRNGEGSDGAQPARFRFHVNLVIWKSLKTVQHFNRCLIPMYVLAGEESVQSEVLFLDSLKSLSSVPTAVTAQGVTPSSLLEG
jgi:hypothetical protein